MFKFQRWVVIGCTLLTSAGGLASESIDSLLDVHIPVVYGAKKCPKTPIEVPEGMRAYQFLPGKDCFTHFVLPPAIAERSLKSRPTMNMKRCDAYQIALENEGLVAKQIFETNMMIGELQEQLRETKEDQEVKALEERIHNLGLVIDRFQETAKEAQESVQRFASILGVEYQVMMDSRVLENDLERLIQTNLIPETSKDADGNWQTIYRAQNFLKAPISESIYSFIFKNNKSPENGSSLAYSTIPGMENLTQEGGQLEEVAHVFAGNVLSGSFGLTLAGACNSGPETAEDTGSDEGVPFVANRSFKVQQQYGFGYTASLDLNGVLSQILDHTVTSNNKGFSKKQVFNNQTTQTIDQLLTIKFDETLNVGDQVGQEALEAQQERIEGIRQEVYARFVDTIFDSLLGSKAIEIAGPSPLDPATGGNENVSKTKSRCWIETKWYGRRRKKCRDYTYTVKKWHDGVTVEDLQNTLTLEGNLEEKVNVADTHGFNFSTVFANTTLQDERGIN